VGASLIARAVKRLGPEAVLAALDQDQRNALPWVWRLWARPEQLAPTGDWRWWAAIAGRGFGKTRLGAEWVREKAAAMPGSMGALIGQTPDEVRKVQIEGPVGILAVSPAGERPEWEPSKGLLTWPNGTKAEIYSGAKPEGFRGPQFHWLWADELAKWAKATASFTNFNFGLRLEWRGPSGVVQPQGLITTTPRPIDVIRKLVKNPRAVITKGSTYDNAANLASSFLDELRGAYEGTRLAEQELHGRLLDDTPGALWKRAMFDREGFRVRRDPEHFDLICVAIDPAASDTDSSDETGIVVVGAFTFQGRRFFHVLEDVSLYGTPSERASAAIAAFHRWKANRLVVETNNGGDWVTAVLQSQWEKEEHPGAAPIEAVTASRGKQTRAEPSAALYEQSRVSHEPGLEVLEDQLVTWSPLLAERSPDRMDALVWALTWLSTAKVLVLT
jgi:phage terminase large subunit-like protein